MQVTEQYINEGYIKKIIFNLDADSCSVAVRKVTISFWSDCFKGQSTIKIQLFSFAFIKRFMATESEGLCLIIYRTIRLRFRVQTLKDLILGESTVMNSSTIRTRSHKVRGCRKRMKGTNGWPSCSNRLFGHLTHTLLEFTGLGADSGQVGGFNNSLKRFCGCQES